MPSYRSVDFDRKDDDVGVLIEFIKEEEDGFYQRAQAVLVYEDDDVKIVQPTVRSAMVYFGRGTEWNIDLFRQNATPIRGIAADTDVYIVFIKSRGIRYAFYLSYSSEYNGFITEGREMVDPRALADEYPTLWGVFRQPSLNRNSLVLVIDPTEEEQLSSIAKNPIDIKYIPSPSETVQLALVGISGAYIKHLSHPSEAVILKAVEQDGHAIKFIEHPSEAVQLKAIESSGSDVILNIKEPTEAANLAAMKLNPSRAIHYI